MQAVNRNTERTTNTFSLLVTAAIWGFTHQPPMEPPPPPPPPVEEVAVTLMAPPPEPTPPAPPVEQAPPPPPVVAKETVPLLPPKPKKQKPKPQPPKQVVQKPMVTPPPQVKPAQAPAQPRPVVSTAEPQFISVLHSYFKSITKYPKDRKARLQKMQGAARVQFTMSRSGSISDVSIVSSAGSPILDQQAISTVTYGNPPPIPAGAWQGQAQHVFLVTIEFVSPG